MSLCQSLLIFKLLSDINDYVKYHNFQILIYRLNIRILKKIKHRMYANNVLTFEVDKRSIHSNIKINSSKWVVLNANDRL